MADNTTITATDLVDVKILANGAALKGEYGVLSVHTSRYMNRVATARIVLSDGDPAKKDFSISSNDDALTPGKEVEIQMGYHDGAKTIFKGIIVNHAIRSAKNKHSSLTLEIKDKAFLLCVARRSKCFTDQTDSEIMEAVATDAGFPGGDIAVDSTSLKHKEMVQFNATAWDFIVSRAEVNGLLVLTNNNKLVVSKPDTSQAAAKELVYGTDVISFDSEIDGRTQFSEVKSAAWNYKNQAVEESGEASITYKESGNLKGDDLASGMHMPAYELFHSGNIGSEELKAWSEAQLLKSRLAKNCGRIRIKGVNDLQPGQVITLTGFSRRFNGNVLVTGICQDYDKSAWETEVHFGLAFPWFHEHVDIADKQAAGLLPGVHGLQIGIVTQLENDPDGQDRIKIQLPLADNRDGIWARMASLDAGNKRGAFFRPEINDEVVVAFVNDDPRFPVVLGMLNSSAKPAPLKASNSNPEKGWVTRSNIKVIFNDDKKSLQIETPAGKKLVLDDDADSITISDQHNNKITMGANGITIESGKDINIKSASGNLKAQANNIDHAANMNFTAKGNGQASVSSTGQTVIKGAVVNIN